MRARKVKAYECPRCGEPHTEEPEKLTVWYVEDVDAETGLTATEPEEREGFLYECGQLGEEPAEFQEAWECGECGAIYFDKEEAKECCQW